MKIRLWRSSPEGHREVSEEEALRIEREGRPPEPQGPTGVVSSGWLVEVGGPTGAVTGATGLTGSVVLRDGEWYAFRLYRLGDADELAEEIYARARSDGLTGFLELREIPAPWLCRKCGLGYQEGAHTEFGFTGPGAHDYTARAAREEEPSP